MSTTYKNYPDPIIWRSNVRPFTLTSGMVEPAQLKLLKGTILSPGSDIMYKSGKAYAAVTADVTINLFKDHSFGVGDALFDGSTELEITAIDTTTSALYDIVTVDANATLTANEVVYSTASGAVAASGLAVIAEDVTFETGDVIHVTIADKVVMDLSRMPNYWALALTGDLKTT